MKLLKPENHATVALQTQAQKQFRGRDASAETLKAQDWRVLTRSGEDNTLPLEVCFEWETDRRMEVFRLSCREDLSDGIRIQTCDKQLRITNLLAAQRYYWQVGDSQVFTFTTEDLAPRWLSVGGLSNVRDNGNWKTLDGHRTRQGLLFRGTEMDNHHAITDGGKWVMTQELKIRTDVDLRGESIGSPLGDKVQYKQVLAGAYTSFITDKEKCKALFDIFAEKSNYPIYLHCWGGADRTGTIFYILNAMLGVARRDLERDYELTTLSIWGERSCNSEQFISLEKALAAYGTEEDSVQEKATRFLLDCGVTWEQMERIRNILVE